VRIQLLEKCHKRKNFYCEDSSLTDYIRKQVSHDLRKKLAICFVAVDAKQNVTGYYTLTSESFGRKFIPDKYLSLVPQKNNASVVLLGRLARDIKVKGTGLREFLLMDALFRSYKLSTESIGALAVVVDSMNDMDIEFYKKYGFEQLPDSKKMFLSMEAIGRLI